MFLSSHWCNKIIKETQFPEKNHVGYLFMLCKPFWSLPFKICLGATTIKAQVWEKFVVFLFGFFHFYSFGYNKIKEEQPEKVVKKYQWKRFVV